MILPRAVRTGLGVAVAAALAVAGAPPALGASPTKGAGYEYESFGARSAALSFRVSRSGRTVRDVFMLIELSCSNGRRGFATLLDVDRPWRLRVARDGTFAGTFAASEEFLDPFATSEAYSLSGAFARRGRLARLVFRARHVGEAGTVCDTGERRVTARRKPRG